MLNKFKFVPCGTKFVRILSSLSEEFSTETEGHEIDTCPGTPGMDFSSMARLASAAASLAP
jgi:hypothetical protein